MSGSLLDLLTTEISALLAPLTDAVANPGRRESLLSEIGVLNTDDPTLVNALQAVAALQGTIEQLASQSGLSFDTVRNALSLSGQALSALSALKDAGAVVSAATGLGQDLVNLLLTGWLVTRHPVLRSLLVLLTVVEPLEEQDDAGEVDDANGQLIRAPFRVDKIHLSRVGDLLHDPVGTLRAEYTNALATDDDATAIATKLFSRLQLLLADIGVSVSYGIDPSDETALADSAPYMKNALVIYTDDLLAGAAAEAGVAFSISPASRGDLGLVANPFGALNFTRQFGNWNFQLQATAGVGGVAWGHNGLKLLTSASSATFSASIAAATEAEPDGTPAYVLGEADGTRLEIGAVAIAFNTQLSEAQQSLSVSADLTNSALILTAGDSDGFLASLLPSQGLRANFALGLTWSNTTGLALRGSAGLDANIPIALSIGGVSLQSIHLSLQAQQSVLDTELSATLAANIGPVQAVLDRVGIAANLDFTQGTGNVGVGDFSLDLKPPSGVGLSLDVSGVVTGGGFLQYDPTQKQYAGAVQLSLHDEITLNAYGLISTRMPDGSAGFSMLIFITADGFEPVPLGFGFQLQKIGGLVGIHRTFDQDVLRAGLKTDTLAQIMFPRDPIDNAAAIIQALARAFPAQQGSYLLGLMARITWFDPPLVQMDLALILQLGSQTRLLALGRVAALLPTQDNDLVRINLDALGVLDFGAGTFAADAVLVDSRLVHQFPITGSAALRAAWQGNTPAANSSGATAAIPDTAVSSPSTSSFVLAVGGVNPHFTPPTGFPTLDRVTIALCSGKNPQLLCDAYLAITSNTIQFGAHAHLYAEAVGFSITGDLGFDALIQLVPPHFLIDFHASVQLKRGSTNLFKVTVDGSLEGPIPLKIAAKATFEILWISFSVHFNFTLVDGSSSQSLPAVDLTAQLTQALADPASWATQRAPGLAHGVALRSLPATAGLVLDPLGQLVVQQQVAPLNTSRDIDTYDGATVSGNHRFQLTGALNGQAGSVVEGAFAPARYFVMSDDDKLSAPSFETLDAGLVLGDGVVSFDAGSIIPAPLQYDAITLNPLATAAAQASATPAAPAAPAPAAPASKAVAPTATVTAQDPAASVYTMPFEAFDKKRQSGAAAKAPVRQVGRARFRNTTAQPAATVSPQRWNIVKTSDGSTLSLDPSVRTWSEYRAALATLNRGSAAYTMVPAQELPAK